MPAARISLVLGVPEAEIYAFAEKLAEEYENGGRGEQMVLDLEGQETGGEAL